MSIRHPIDPTKLSMVCGIIPCPDQYLKSNPKVSTNTNILNQVRSSYAWPSWSEPHSLTQFHAIIEVASFPVLAQHTNPQPPMIAHVHLGGWSGKRSFEGCRRARDHGRWAQLQGRIPGRCNGPRCTQYMPFSLKQFEIEFLFSS